MPWTSDTTAMIDVTATMLPRTVRNDRSLFDQMADRAMNAASRNWWISASSYQLLRFRSGRSLGGLDLDGRTVAELANRCERSNDDLIAGLHTGEHLEVFL